MRVSSPENGHLNYTYGMPLKRVCEAGKSASSSGDAGAGAMTASPRTSRVRGALSPHCVPRETCSTGPPRLFQSGGCWGHKLSPDHCTATARAWGQRARRILLPAFSLAHCADFLLACERHKRCFLLPTRVLRHHEPFYLPYFTCAADRTAQVSREGQSHVHLLKAMF